MLKLESVGRAEVHEGVEAVEDGYIDSGREAEPDEIEGRVDAREPERVLDHVHDEQDHHARCGFDLVLTGVAGHRVEKQSVDLVDEELERAGNRVYEPDDVQEKVVNLAQPDACNDRENEIGKRPHLGEYVAVGEGVPGLPFVAVGAIFERDSMAFCPHQFVYCPDEGEQRNVPQEAKKLVAAREDESVGLLECWGHGGVFLW